MTELVERGRVETFTDVVRLRALGLGARVIDVLDREIQLVLVPFGVAAELAGDCLDHVVVFGERHLRCLLNSYQKYYNGARTHLSLQKDAPIPRGVQAVGQTLAVPILGGLHHQCIRA